MKCIGDKCDKHFESDWWAYCTLVDTHIRQGEDCPIKMILIKQEMDCVNTKILMDKINQHQI